MSSLGLDSYRYKVGWDAFTSRWDAMPARTRTRILLVVLIASIIFAYHYSLETLLENLNSETPLAYTGLVPLIAAGLAAVRARPIRNEPDIHDRQLDWIVGIPLMATALAIQFILPAKMSSLYWMWRIDLIGLPVFVAGSVALLFGTRVLWRVRLAVFYLFFAWPYPYTTLLNRVLSDFTNLTVSTLQHVVKVIHVAKAVPGSGDDLFNVVHHGVSFPLSVVSACSGIDSVVGFLLVGVGFGAIVTGPRLRKTMWLGGGMLLLWMINLGRLMLIFWIGHQWGEHIAIDVFHPFIGLVTFNLGIVAMVLALRPLGLNIMSTPVRSIRLSSAVDRFEMPKLLGVSGCIVVLAAAIGISNSGLRSYDLVANAAGEPKLVSFTSNPGEPKGWTVSYDAQYTWARAYFGGSSTWYRYLYTATNSRAPLYSSLSVTADVVNAASLSGFNNYGVEACYQFHGYHLQDVAQVHLGGDITGQSLSYTTSSLGDWSVVYWIWPVKPPTASGSTRYERVILYLLNTNNIKLRYPGAPPAVQTLSGSISPTSPTNRNLIAVRSFLVDFARQLVHGQAMAHNNSALVAAPNSTMSTSDPNDGSGHNAYNAKRYEQAARLEAVVRLPEVTKAAVATKP